MKRVIFLLLFLPQLALAQYNAECFHLKITDDIKPMTFRKTIADDLELPIILRTPIYGLSVSGKVIFEDEDESYVRITLKDEYNYEYLVYENYPLLADNMSVDFENIAIETIKLKRITPRDIKVELKNATLTLDSLYYVVSSDKYYGNETVLQKEQSQHIVHNLNKNLAKHNKLWRAGMTSMIEKTYEEKKAMFGGKLPPLYGLEYYTCGIYEMPGVLKSTEETRSRSVTYSPFVSAWDWRIRHGKNWITCVKDQWNCGSCWAHAAVGVVESYVNLYYNRLINPNLSEQEIISCTYVGCNSGYINKALNYIQNNGIVNEQCFHYQGAFISCGSRCNDPDTLLFINGHKKIKDNADSIKRALFKNPLTITVKPWTHSLVLVGYKTIEVGDVIHLGNLPNHNLFIIVDNENYHDYIGKTAWILKNSGGTSWGDNGYMYALVNTSDISDVYSPIGAVTCDSINNIVCEDADGDGYYYWGVGPKPANFPPGVHDTPDGDDSNSQLGPVDPFGHLTDLSNLASQTVISGNTAYSTNMTMSNNTVVIADAILTITGTVTMASGAKLTVHYNGTIVVDGGTLQNADLALNSGCHVIVKNGGNIIMQSGKFFDAPYGATVDVIRGKIQ